MKNLFLSRRMSDPSQTFCMRHLNTTFAGMKILMVCIGNICRSPLAEGILQHKAFHAGLHWSVESAGTHSYHIGEAPHRLSQKVAKLNSIDISQQRARRFTAADFDVYDKIYAMTEEILEDIRRIAKHKFDSNKAELLLNELHPGKNLPVPDPWYGTEQGYHEVYTLMNDACEMIIEKYKAAPNLPQNRTGSPSEGLRTTIS